MKETIANEIYKKYFTKSLNFADCNLLWWIFPILLVSLNFRSTLWISFPEAEVVLGTFFLRAKDINEFVNKKSFHNLYSVLNS